MKALSIVLVFTLLIFGCVWFVQRNTELQKSATDESPQPVKPIKHPPYEFQPDWESLHAYQNTLSAPELLRLIEDVYAVGDTWKQVISIDEGSNQATIQTAADQPPFILELRDPDQPAPNDIPRYWSTGPLASLHIAIDPGHIGGDYAGVEKRQFGRPQDRPVREGEMSLQTAIHLKPMLEALGAKVSLVRSSNEPVTKRRTDYYLDLYRKENPGVPDGLLKSWAEKRFYRRAEIVERARIVNEQLRPDLVLCLHYNASGDSSDWLDASKPKFSKENHLHFLVNGAYTRGEVLSESDRFQMMERILQRIHQREAELSAVIADVFAEQSGLPPYSYDPDSLRAKNVDNHPYLWARNLLANRSYTCPVVFFEPWVMNHKEIYDRAQLGDYEGEKEVNGELKKSLMREYAEIAAAGVERFFALENLPTESADPVQP